MTRFRTKRNALVAAGVIALVGAALITSGPVSARAPRGLIATMTSSTGSRVGTVRVVPQDDGKLLVHASAAGLEAGFHGFHVHTTGICDREATDDNGDTAPFFSAGGHYNPDERNHGNHAGDMPPLLAAADGTALLRFKTDRFRVRQLMDEDGSAIVMHADTDNLANIPATTSEGAERYHSHAENTIGPDAITLSTGDAGARFACGVLRRVRS